VQPVLGLPKSGRYLSKNFNILKFFFSFFIFFFYLFVLHFISISYLFFIDLKSKFKNLLNLKSKLNKTFQNQISIPTTDFLTVYSKRMKKKELNPNVSQSAKI